MNFSIENRNKIVIFTVKQRHLNSESSAQFKAELLILCQPDIDALVLDLSTIEIVDSSGLGGLLLAHRQLKEHAIPVVLVGVGDMLRMLLGLSQIDKLFDYANTVEEAIEALEGDF
jgi:anti-sigma B factor antagonist